MNKVLCQFCNGTGYNSHGYVCESCHGKGFVIYSASIPPHKIAKESKLIPYFDPETIDEDGDKGYGWVHQKGDDLK